jgi:hypothetical protein
VFFSKRGVRLGDKNDFAHEIEESTGIPVGALQGNLQTSFNVEDILGWAGRRKAVNEEDYAYALQGIFDVSLPLIYGEGKTNAIARLKTAIYARQRRMSSKLICMHL